MSRVDAFDSSFWVGPRMNQIDFQAATHEAEAQGGGNFGFSRILIPFEGKLQNLAR